MYRSLLVLFIFLFTIAVNTAECKELFIVSGNNVPYPDTAEVYLPKSYTKTRSFPATFMLHGWSGNYRQWGKITNLQSYADKYQMIIICPNGYYDSWYLDSPKDPKMQFETFFIKNFIPEANRHYNLDTKNLFITGLSMGGHGALYLFLKHPDVFRAAGSTSGGLSFTPKTVRFGVGKYLGAYNAHIWEKYSVRGNLLKIKRKNKKFIFDCGKSDFFYQRNLEIDKLCKIHRIAATFISQEGNHSRKYWKKSIMAHFDFFENALK